MHSCNEVVVDEGDENEQLQKVERTVAPQGEEPEKGAEAEVEQEALNAVGLGDGERGVGKGG